MTVHFVIFSANKIPYSDDTGHAYYKRWLIFHFERSFREGAKDINLIHKLTTDNELSGLLNLALVGLKQLEKDWSFRDISVEDVKRDYERKSNIVKAFLQECYRNGLILYYAGVGEGPYRVRMFLPGGALTVDELNEGLEILRFSLSRVMAA